MMGALIAAGMRGNYNPKPDWWKKEMNPKGFFENPPVPVEHAYGMVTKIRFKHPVPADAKCIWMERPMAEQLASRRKRGVPTNFDRITTPESRLTVVQFHDLLDAPQSVFERLVREGWPLKDEAAFCAWIEPELATCRV